uniref:Legume lectin domain-containing protein n=1 Tax=Nelumbo nucifera TaxID=4432 RepID=A0A822XG40_NELNU|nr:TPA_asm: hypothetical protein HUJ06_019258 [Nelumbo nucifera]
MGNNGGFLGLVGRNAMSGFIVVELDTLMDVEFRDINGNHVDLDLNGLLSTQVGDLGAVNVELKSGDLVNAWIDYDGPTRSFNISVSPANRSASVIQSRPGTVRQRFHVRGFLWFDSREYRDSQH